MAHPFQVGFSERTGSIPFVGIGKIKGAWSGYFFNGAGELVHLAGQFA
jgi:hypothetical protein